jgi:hypothetical protein
VGPHACCDRPPQRRFAGLRRGAGSRFSQRMGRVDHGSWNNPDQLIEFPRTFESTLESHRAYNGGREAPKN